MFADDKSIENFQQLFFEFKKYLELQKEYTKLELTEKLTILFSTLIMILVLIILGMVALFYLLFALAYILEPLVGGLMSSFAIIAGINVVLIALVIIFRKQLIISPMVNFLANLFLTDSISISCPNSKQSDLHKYSMNAQTPQKFTLEKIAERKKKLLNEIHAQKKAMTATTREIFAPLAPATNKADALMRSFNTGMAVFDGVVMGIKIMRKIRAYFRNLR